MRQSHQVHLFIVLLLFTKAAVFASDMTNQSKRIVFLGDSLTAGYSLPIDQSYPSLIQAKIDQSGLSYRVLNSGISGDTTAGGLRRLDWILRQPVDTLVIALGANDGLRGLPLEEVESNIVKMIEKVRTASPDTRVLLAGINLPLNMGDEYRAAFEAIYPRVAARHQLPLLPFMLEGVAGVPELNLPDGIHPTAEGHRIIADHMWRFIRPLLDEPPAPAN